MRKLTAAGVLVAALVAAPLAFAAASPTVAAKPVTSIADTAATLHGTINPNGLATTYQFEYGPTTALGKAIPATAGSAGSGTTVVAKSNRVGGLAPDTTYYYELVATNKDGTSTTPIESFKTTGNPAPTSTTDPAVNVGHYAGTAVGTIAPNNQATTYFFQYGQTSSYGFQTAVQSVPAGTAPVTVTVVLSGLSPGTTFHYRLVSSHGVTATTYGDDMSFQTLPWPRWHTGMSIVVRPRATRGRAARISVHGNIALATATPAPNGCRGLVTLRYYAGRHRIASTRAFVGGRCGFSASARVRNLQRDGRRIIVRARFEGNTYQAPVNRSAVVRVTRTR